jgi:TetR/AcrR family transcriptional regulator, transcriptional repressor for nem operon
MRSAAGKNGKNSPPKKTRARVSGTPQTSTAAPLAASSAENAQERLLAAATELFRRDGYVATTVDEICARAGVTKGAFFHHFAGKEALAVASLERWDAQAAARDDAAPFRAVEDPRKRLLACMDYYIRLFSNARLLKSCLAGTTVQEVSQTHPALRDAANVCFAGAEKRFTALLDAACRGRKKGPDTTSLARLWMATIQGSLILAKASQNESVIPRNLEHVKEYIATQISRRRT